MISLRYNGRLGNNLIQYFASYFFAKKNNLFLNAQPISYSGDWVDYFGVNNLEGEIGNEFFEINDSNFLDFFFKEKVEKKHYYFNGYFQYKKFLSSIRDDIKQFPNLTYEKPSDDLVFVHYRVGDIINDRRMLPFEYYVEALDNLNFNGGYLSSDSPDHPFCVGLSQKYNLKIIDGLSPLQVIDFGKNYNNIVLSEGTFSWWIGFLSNAKNIICNKRDYLWHGDVALDEWKSLSWDYEPDSIYDNYKLKSYNPKKIYI